MAYLSLFQVSLFVSFLVSCSCIAGSNQLNTDLGHSGTGYLASQLIFKVLTDIETDVEEVKTSVEEIHELKADVADVKELKTEITETLEMKADVADIQELKTEITETLEFKADVADIQALKAKMEDLEFKYEDLQWEDWSPWGQCTAHCTNGVGDRLQSRTRNKKNSAISGTSTQTESRPCNSVQFAGCISPQNGDEFFAISYDYQHMLAQSTCTAMAPAGRVNAVRRTCSSEALDCNAVCQKLGTDTTKLQRAEMPITIQTAGPVSSKDLDGVATIQERTDENRSDIINSVPLETLTYGANQSRDPSDSSPPRGTYKYKYWTQTLSNGNQVQREAKIPLNREEKAEWKSVVCYHSVVLLVYCLQIFFLPAITPIVPLVFLWKAGKEIDKPDYKKARKYTQIALITTIVNYFLLAGVAVLLYFLLR